MRLADTEENMNNRLIATKAFKRSPSSEISTWYKGVLSTQLAGAEETGGDFERWRFLRIMN